MMKRTIFSAMIMALCISGFAGNNRMRTNITQGSHEILSREAPDSAEWGQSKENMFMKNAMTDGIMENQLGLMAQKRGNSKDVRDLGQMLAENHSDADGKLRQIAGEMNAGVPDNLDKADQKTLDDLKLKPANEFSKEFIDMVVRKHKQAISDFKSAETRLPDGKLHDWVQTNIPVLEKHLSHAEMIQKKMNTSGMENHATGTKHSGV